MTSDLQAVDEQSLDLLGRAAGGLEEASLDAQDFCYGPSFTGLFRNLDGLRNDLQCGIGMSCLGVSLGLECQKYRQPQARSGVPPRRHSVAKQLDAQFRLAPKSCSPATQNAPTRSPKRKAMLATKRNDPAGIGWRQSIQPCIGTQRLAMG